MAGIYGFFFLLTTCTLEIHCNIPKYRIRHVDSDLSLKVENDKVVLEKYNTNSSFWWNIAIDEVAKLTFYNTANRLFLTKWRHKIIMAELTITDYGLVQWHYFSSGAIINAKNPAFGLGAPKNVKSGDALRLVKGAKDEFSLELVTESGEPVRLSGSMSYQQFMKYFLQRSMRD